MLSVALHRFAAALTAVLLLAAAAAFGVPDGTAALGRAAAGLPATLGLTGGALLVGVMLGVPLGLAAGWLGVWLATLGAAVPGFLAAALVVAVLGGGSPVAAALALAVPVLAEAARLARAGAAAAERQGFVLAARGRGVPAPGARLRHMMPAALTPVAGGLGPLAAVTVAGAVAAETLFGLPGTGRLLVEAARVGDAAGTAAAAALLAGLVLLLRALGAVLRAGLDPRARVE